jgi:hypothetical protein
MRKLLAKKGVYTRPPRVRRVYFVRAASGGPIKIGTSLYVSARVSNLQIGRPDRLVVMATFIGGHKDEKALHRRFASLHVGGEWFRDEPELLGFIEELPR